MPSTSLVEQLQKLSVPQSSIYKDEKKKVSLLFDPKEAASKDRDTFYEIGLSGLKELITLYEGFCVYEESLFSISSKDFERAVQSKEVNQNLDQTIEKFLLQLSPYFLLQSSHKALEWLVNRYHIHQYNQDAIMALILPYHETKIFTRFIQLFKLAGSRWDWLEPVQKHGIPLTKQVLHNQCVSNTSTLQFIAKNTSKYVTEYGERATQLNTVFAFFCSTSIGTINTTQYINESIISALLPTIIKGLESPITDFRASAYVLLGYLSTKATLKKKTINELIVRLLTAEFDLSYDVVLLINLIYTNQKHLAKMPEAVLCNISVDVMQSICKHLKKLVELKINIHVFSQVFLASVLPILQRNIEDFRRFCQLPEIFIQEVDLKQQQPEKLIKQILNALKCSKKDHASESDIEIIDVDDDDGDGFSDKILAWYSQYLKNIENKYPEIFDKVIKKEMSSDSKHSLKKQQQLSKVLQFKPAVAHKVGGTYLFENLYHVNAQLRVEAVNYIAKEFHALKLEDKDFLKDSIVSRLNDDNADVVIAALEISNENLKEVLTENDLTNVLGTIAARDSKKWLHVIKKAISKFCMLEILPLNQKVVLSIIPYMFPNDNESAEFTYKIICSPWAKKFGLTNKSVGVKSAKHHNNLNEGIFKALFVERIVTFDGILDSNQLNKDSTLDIFFFILLKSSSFNKASGEEAIDILNIILESVENRVIVSHEKSSFSSEQMPEFIKLARKNKISFEILEYVFTRITDQLNVDAVLKPWCNLLNSPDTILIRRIYEIFITGCDILNYKNRYAKLLQKFLQKLFRNPNEKFDFVANFACGHILYAVDPKDIISPELQLRSLKLMETFLDTDNNTEWIYNSDVLILTILFDLNNPIVPIRQCIINIINSILKNNPDKNLIFVQLMKQLIAHKQELLLDHEQLPQVIKTILTEQSMGNKLFRKNCLIKLTGVLIGDKACHIKSALVRILSSVNNVATFCQVIPSINSLEKVLKQSLFNKKFAFDIYESTLIRNIYSQINEITVSAFDREQVWNSIEVGLEEYRECVLNEDLSFVSPCVLILREINENVFAKVPEEKTKDLIYLITFAGAFSNNPAIASAASKVMKKIHLHFDNFKTILERMLKITDPMTNVAKKKKASTMSMLSYQLTETDDWRLGITLLEYVQSKKKMTVDTPFVTVLFQLLNKCLRFEEQSYVEYTKQLILSSLWYFCKKFVNDTDKEQLNSVKNIFNVEIIVQCIRGTQNPQTQHHALILLSHAAYMLPEQVLHHTMEIFTFMGSSVLRHDDAYSFQIITKIIETLIPILVKLDKNIEEHTEKELQQLENRVVPVLRIFADVVLHVPEHRRLPLYKKLIETLGPSQFLWIFIALLLETHIAHFNDNKKKDKRPPRTLADQESPINRMDFGQSILLEFPPEICLENFIKLTAYMKSLPLHKDEDSMETNVDPSDIFSVNGHTPIQLRHYKYVIVTFMTTCLSSSRFIHHSSQVTNVTTMESHYKTFIINILTFIQSISKVSDEKTAKYWRVMLHHSYDLLDHINNLLSALMFLSVIRGLLKHNLQTVRRKAMELLNTKIQFSPEMFIGVDKDLLFSLIPALLDIVKTIDIQDDNLDENAAQELELNQQTALLSLKLFTRLLGSENPEQFTPVLETVTNYTCNPNISGNVMASIVLCLAEICGNLKAHALSSLRKFMPALIKVLKKQRKADTPQLVLLSTVTAISKIVESLPLFLSPYLQKILYEYALLLSKWQTYDQECSKVSAVVSKLINIKKKIANSIPPRVLIPVANETHRLILEKESLDAVGPVMSVLADSFTNITTADFTALQHDLTGFFLSALKLRSEAYVKDFDMNVVDKAEDEVVKALVSLVLKLSETSFRPFYFRIYDWAIRTNVDGQKDRAITFYRLSSAIADKLKGLFVLFAGHFVKNAAELLDACNNSKTEQLFFESDEKCITLVNYIIKTLNIVFLYDSQSFLNKDRFETLMQPVVDQLENTVCGIVNLKSRATEVIIPCISQFAVATADDSLWKLLNYQVLLKTRHNDAEIRLIGLECLVAMASQLGTNWLPLLAESVPFLAELLEDGDPRIEVATKNAVRTLEQILGEPLEKYF